MHLCIYKFYISYTYLCYNNALKNCSSVKNTLCYVFKKIEIKSMSRDYAILYKSSMSSQVIKGDCSLKNENCHPLCFFQACITFFMLWDTNEDIWSNLNIFFLHTVQCNSMVKYLAPVL